MNLTFNDVNRNPLPAGVQVLVTNASSTLVGSSFLGIGGITILDIPVGNSTTYTASFVGTHAPTKSFSFTTLNPASSTPALVVPQYNSPDLTVAQYAATLVNTLPTGWFSDAAKAAGGNLYSLAYSSSQYMYELDKQWQAIILLSRLMSCTGADIDSWAADYFGSSLPRFSGESDANYINRIKANLQADKSTLAGMTTIAQTFGTNVWVSEPWNPIETGGVDSVSCTVDGGGEVGDQNPFVRVWLVSSNVVPDAQLKSTIAAIKPAGMAYEVVKVSGSNGTIL